MWRQVIGCLLWVHILTYLSHCIAVCDIPDSKVDGANMGPMGDRQDPGGPHVGPINFTIWDCILLDIVITALDYIFISYKS